MKGLTIVEILDAIKACEASYSVVFDFCGLTPTTLKSWRGVYAEPAISWCDLALSSVSDFRAQLLRADGREVFHGYKGGTYTFLKNQVLHVDLPNRCTDTVITAVEITNRLVILHTGRQP